MHINTDFVTIILSLLYVMTAGCIKKLKLWDYYYVNRNCTYIGQCVPLQNCVIMAHALGWLIYAKTSTKIHILIIVFSVLQLWMQKCWVCPFAWCFSETEDSCKVCCRSNGLCTPFVINGSPLYLRKGKPCTVGFCDGAVSTLLVCVLTMIIHQTE